MPDAKSTRTADPAARRAPRFFYGYWILAVAFFCAFINAGCGFYTFSLFVTPLQTQFGWGRGEIMMGLTIFFLIAGVSAPVVGRLVDRYGARPVMAAGASLSGLGFVSLSFVGTLWQFYAGYIVAGLGMAAAGLVPGTALVSNWFQRWRGTAVGIMSSGIGAGGFAFAPFIGAYLIPRFGWQKSYLALALFSWLIVPLALLVIRTKPSDMGLCPDGNRTADSTAVDEDSRSSAPSAPPSTARPAHGPSPTPKEMTLRKALTTSSLWFMAVSFLAHGFSEVGILQTQVPYLRDIGFPSATASTAFGIVGLFSLVGKFGFGWLCDRIQPKNACAIGLGVELVALVIFLGVSLQSPGALLWLYAVVMGLGVGSWLPAMSMIVSTSFGLSAYGAIFGVVSFSMSIGASTGPLVSGHIFDVTGSYHSVFLLFVCLYAVAIVTVLAVRRPDPMLRSNPACAP